MMSYAASPRCWVLCVAAIAIAAYAVSLRAAGMLDDPSKELREQLAKMSKTADTHRRAAEEARKRISQLQQRVAELNVHGKPDPTPAPTADTSDVGGPITVIAAAYHCNCPALMRHPNATQAIALNQRGAFHRSWPAKPGDSVPFRDYTEEVQKQCTGKTACNIEIPETPLAVRCWASYLVDYRCSTQSPPRLAAIINTARQGMTLSVDCSKPRELPAPSRRVGVVTPVKYVYHGRTLEVWPIQFSIPEWRVHGQVSWKDRDFAPSIPGNPATYKHKQNAGAEGKSLPDRDYFDEYKHSYYCVTRKKKGWDTMRHYEILSQGCVPYFIDLDRLPPAMMPFFPRDLVLEAMNLPGVKFDSSKKGSIWYPENFSINHRVFNKTRYYELATKILQHTRKHLTSKAMVRYILKALEVSNGPKAKKVLFIHHCYQDYLSDSVWHGLKDLELDGELDLVADIVPPKEMGLRKGRNNYVKTSYWGDCRDGRKQPLMTERQTLNRLWFYGWVNSWALHRAHSQFDTATAVDPTTLESRIQNKEFDVVIYGTPLRTTAWIETVEQNYPATSVAFLLGGDLPEDHLSVLSSYSSSARIFAREVFDQTGAENHQVCSDAPGAHDVMGLDCCEMQDVTSRIVWSDNANDTTKWLKCSKEDETCTCSTRARFGDPVGGRWSVIDLGGKETRVVCKNALSGGPFVDPALGSPKLCQCELK
eukprot:Sspe_Gene.19867::Locus_7261_Transcript_1_1_Confidence_1.000_Length_2173::g.19867::m.19867